MDLSEKTKRAVLQRAHLGKPCVFDSFPCFAFYKNQKRDHDQKKQVKIMRTEQQSEDNKLRL